ncbi:MAG TPA: 50S ribosomal protein L17 [bacterium]|nr:50S ribosomal protein L17 [bacterium]
MKCGRDREYWKALVRNQVISLFTHGKIKTTLKKAKLTRSYADWLISLAQNNTLHNRRLALKFLVDKKITNKLFYDIAPLFKGINGGYTRIIRLGFRRGDNAEMALLELTREINQNA